MIQTPDDNERDRLVALQSYQILDTPPEKDFDDLTRLASIICHAPIALISLIDEDRQWFKSCMGLNISETDRASSFCNYAIGRPDEIMIVEDAHQDSRLKDDPLVKGEPYIIFYAGVPLVTEEGFAIGSLCVIDRVKRTLTQEQKEALQMLSGLVIEKLELRRSNVKLKASNTANEILHQQLSTTLEGLSKAEKNLRLAMEGANFGQWIFERLGNHLSVSDVYKKQFGFQPSESFDFADLLNYTEPAFVSLIRQAFDDCLRMKKDLFIEFAIRHKTTDERRWMRSVGKTESDRKGTTVYITGINTDITEQRNTDRQIRNLNEELLSINAQMQGVTDDLLNANEELQRREEELINSNNRLFASEEQMRIAAESANFGMWDLNLQTRDLVVSDNMKILYGFDANEIMTLDKYFSVSNQSDQAMLQQVVQEATDMGKPAIAEFRITDHTSKELKWMRAIGKVHKDADGKPWRLIGMTADITDQKTSTDLINKLNSDLQNSIEQLSDQEEILQLAIQSADIGLWQIDLVNNATTLSKRMKIIHGIPPDRDITFEEALSTVMQEFRQSVSEQVVKAVETGNLFVADYKINRMDGSGTGWVHSTGIVNKSKDGNRKILIGACMDITRQKEMQQRRDDFISVASHELKTPVTSLKTCLYLLEWLRDNPDHAMLPELVEQTRQSINRLSRLTDNLLNASRFNQGQIILNKSKFDICALIRNCCSELPPIDGQKMICRCDCLMVEGDELYIGQVIFNLLNNARKYAPKSKLIHLEAKKDNGQIQVSVSDEGPGIPPDSLPYIFDRYFRNEYGGSQYSGLGLGLYICAEIIKLHGGRIWVESKMDKGTTFFFSLPEKQ